MNTCEVNKRGADRVRQGHLWIYRSDVVAVDAEGGSVVTVKDERGNFVGQALFSDASQIALRFLTQSNEEIDRDWWRRRIREAAGRRNISAGHKCLSPDLFRRRSAAVADRRSLRGRVRDANVVARH